MLDGVVRRIDMFSSAGRYLALPLLCSALALALRAEEPPSVRPSSSAKSSGADNKKLLPGPMPFADGKAAEGKKIDLASLPADAIVVVCESTAEALRRVPDAIVLTPKKYLELLDEIARLRRLLQSEKPVAPSTCHLKGKVEDNSVVLQARFDAVTDHPGAVVALACPQAWATAALLDGQTPLLRFDAEGFLVQIEKAGEHHVTLDLTVPLPTRGGESRGFELTLPRAAITSLELDLPANVRDVRVGGRPAGDPLPAGMVLKNKHLGGGLGPAPVDKFDLAWREIRPPSGVPVLTANGNIQVRLDSPGQTTQAELLLKIEGTPTQVWRLLVPLGAEVKVSPADEGRMEAIEVANQQFTSLRTIRLKEASTDPLLVQVMVRAPLPKSGSLAPVGPFFVVGAVRQTGTVTVRNQVRNLHLVYHEHGDMKLQRRTEEPGGEAGVTASFTYAAIPQVENPQGVSGPNSLSWLDLDAELVRGQVRTRVAHALRLWSPPGEGKGDRLRWDITTTIAPASKWSDIEQLRVEVPAEWMPTEEDMEPVREKDARFMTFRSSMLLREGPSQPLTLRGRYEPLQSAKGRAVLKLPRPQGIIEQCEIKIEAPRDTEVSLPNAEQTDLELVKQSGPNEQTWRCRRVGPDWGGIEVRWYPYRPEVTARSIADLTLAGGRADIRHEIFLTSPQPLPPSVHLRVPPAAADSLRIVEGGQLGMPREGQGIVRVVVPAKTAVTEARLVLHYSISLAEGGQSPRVGESLSVPLVVPAQATGGETKVRVWSQPGWVPLPAGAPPWDEQGTEEVKDRTSLPVLVLHAPKIDVPVVLRTGGQAPVYTILVERALVRAQLLENGAQNYRASFQLRQLAGSYLDIELPAPVPMLNVQIALNHRKVTPDIVNEFGRQTDGGTLARLRLGPDLIRQTALLEVFYQLPPGRTGTSPVRTLLQPPLPRGAPATVPTRWLVSVPSSRVLIAPESAAGLERTWTRSRGLLAVRLNCTNADLEREFEETLPAELRGGSGQLDDPSAGGPALVCWQDALEPIELTLAPRLAWLLVCSLGLLIPGLGLYWSARPQPGDAGHMAPWFWPILAVATLAAAVGILFWPTMFWAIAFGCEPGAVVLLGMVGFQWFMHQRYRRQIVFLPSFSRGRAGSSLLRKSSSQRPQPGEPSTVDAPPPGSSGVGVGGS
jgi:hypothetical protein